MRRESDIPDELIGSFVEAHLETSWSPQMYHRLRLIDLIIALEVGARARPQLNLVRTFVEYRRIKKAGRIARETTDFVSFEETPENRIIPDAAFVLENVESGRRALYFLEMDMATERIVTQISNDRRITLRLRSSNTTGISPAAGSRRPIPRSASSDTSPCSSSPTVKSASITSVVL